MAYRFIDHTELSGLIKQGAVMGRDIAVVDVRDQDFVGGNITGAINAPSEERTEESVKDLVKDLRDVPVVVFHCALSQVRGPKAAHIYAEELARQTASPAAPSPPTNELPTAASAAAFSPNPYTPTEGVPKKQEVLVLRDGFTGWQALYRDDPTHVEKFDKSVWGGFAA